MSCSTPGWGSLKGSAPSQLLNRLPPPQAFPHPTPEPQLASHAQSSTKSLSARALEDIPADEVAATATTAITVGEAYNIAFGTVSGITFLTLLSFFAKIVPKGNEAMFYAIGKFMASFLS